MAFASRITSFSIMLFPIPCDFFLCLLCISTLCRVHTLKLLQYFQWTVNAQTAQCKEYKLHRLVRDQNTNNCKNVLHKTLSWPNTQHLRIHIYTNGVTAVPLTEGNHWHAQLSSLISTYFMQCERVAFSALCISDISRINSKRKHTETLTYAASPKKRSFRIQTTSLHEKTSTKCD